MNACQWPISRQPGAPDWQESRAPVEIHAQTHSHGSCGNLSTLWCTFYVCHTFCLWVSLFFRGAYSRTSHQTMAGWPGDGKGGKAILFHEQHSQWCRTSQAIATPGNLLLETWGRVQLTQRLTTTITRPQISVPPWSSTPESAGPGEVGAAFG